MATSLKNYCLKKSDPYHHLPFFDWIIFATLNLRGFQHCTSNNPLRIEVVTETF
jgi:hypothetical protein